MINTTLDVETCGLHGVPVLLQYAYDDGPILCHDLWLEPIDKTIELILNISKTNIIGFNLVFDWFHIYKFFTMLLRFIQEYPEASQDRPYEHVAELAALERDAGKIGCLRPPAACDVMLISKLGPYQSLMDRKNIYIRRIPAVLAEGLQTELEHRVHIDNIYFSRRKSHKDAPRWTITPSKDKDGKLLRGFFDLVLRFKPSGALKVLAHHALKIPLRDIIKRSDVLPRDRPQIDLGYKPWGGDWPKYVRKHAVHWKYNERAREYAKDDVKYTFRLWEHFGSPEPGDVDSDLAIMVACVRWRGMEVKIDEMRRLIETIKPELQRVPQAPRAVKRYLSRFLGEEEQLALVDTKKTTLKSLTTLECDCQYEGKPAYECDICQGTGRHPVSEPAQLVLNARALKKELELYEKIVSAGKLYPSYRVIGTLSGRMSGADRLNPMGIKRNDDVRALFEMADQSEGEVLVGGDFDAYEVVLAIADSGDKKLEADVLKGLKIHALFAMKLFPGMTYKQIVASAGTSDDKYTLGKNGVFTMIFGGDHNTLIHKYGIDEALAIAAFEGFDREYPDLGRWRKETQQRFQLISQERLGAKIQIGEADDAVGSMFGYSRYFTLELQILRSLIDLAEHLPPEWVKLKIKVLRRADKGHQTVSNATRSALYGAAFSVQGAIQRAASNHRIQAAGARVTKVLQHRLWTKFQPVGFSTWRIRPMNIHDEILTPTRPELVEPIANEVQDCVDEFKPKVPLLSIGWGPMESWSKNLQAETVRKLRNESADLKPLELSEKYRIDIDKVSAIRKGTTWRWITAESIT